MRRLRVCALAAFFAVLATAPAAFHAPSGSLALFLLGHRIGEERTTVTANGGASEMRSHFEYLDRGATIALDTTLTFSADFTPLSFASHGKSYRYFSVDASVPNGVTAPNTFTLDGMAPIAAQGLLIRYWLSHGKPASIALMPSGDRAAIREVAVSPLAIAPGIPKLREFTVDGVTWGRQRIWLDAGNLQVAAAVTTAGVLGFAALHPSVETRIEAFTRAAVTARLAEAGREAAAIKNTARRGPFALIGARLIDGTGAPAIEGATVIVRDGRIEAAGRAADITVPAGVERIDVTGRTILPGLWDMHAHVGLAEWGPVYLASGVTTARDMGGEFDVVTSLRKAWADGAAIGPRLLAAGLVDGPGPGSFGHVTAANPDEARLVVERYKRAGFEQMKLYSLLDRPTAAAIVTAAHASGMTVTGHLPNGLTLRDGVEMGMDHVAHLVVRGAPGSDELRDTIAFLQAHGTVIDPTISWSEMLGRSPQTALISIQPGLAHVAPPLRRLLESATGTGTPDQARDRLARSLQIIKALHDAGVPIVAGTDKGVPGVSVSREIELYVQAGLSPMEAIRAATAVPARVMGLARDSGTIAAGLRADLIVVDGNPLERISDIRNVTRVCANGTLYDTAPLWAAGGFLR